MRIILLVLGISSALANTCSNNHATSIAECCAQEGCVYTPHKRYFVNECVHEAELAGRLNLCPGPKACSVDSNCTNFDLCIDGACILNTLNRTCGTCLEGEVCHTLTNETEFYEIENRICTPAGEPDYYGYDGCSMRESGAKNCVSLLNPTNHEWRTVWTTQNMPREIVGLYETIDLNKRHLEDYDNVTKSALIVKAKQRCIEIGCTSFYVRVEADRIYNNFWAYALFSKAKFHPLCLTKSVGFSSLTWNGEVSSFEVIPETGSICKSSNVGEACLNDNTCIPSSMKCVSDRCSPCVYGVLKDDLTCDCDQYYTGENCEILAGPPCQIHEHVQGHTCLPCPEGGTNEAGDDPVFQDTECYAPGTCGGFICSENTLSCENFVCKCKPGFSGVTCAKDISPQGKQNLLEEARAQRSTAVPTKEDIISIQNIIKEFAKDDMEKRLKDGAKITEAIKESRVAVQPEDLQPKMKAIVEKIKKPTLMAVAPANNEQEDTCAQGFDTPGCGMVDVSDNEDEITILTTDPTPGSWSILTSGGVIVSKQTRLSDFEYDMQCWNQTGWGVKTRLNVADESKLYPCNGNVLLIGSQAGICTVNTCNNNGNCTVDGLSYVCSCPPEWTGDHCDHPNTAESCGEFDCSDYGGHKTVQPCTLCNAETCCNYGTKSAFDSICSAATTPQDYVSEKCCHRSICI